MDEEKLIQVNLQLPVSELAGLTAMMEQLRNLLAAGNQAAAGSEQAQNTEFDEGRFQKLEDAASVVSEVSNTFDGQAMSAEPALSELPEAENIRISGFTELAEALTQRQEQWRQLNAVSVTGMVERDLGVPSTAGSPVSDGSGGPTTEHGDGRVERLVTAGPAPLTAEAVSLAFRRDDRRYDNGFPLY